MFGLATVIGSRAGILPQRSKLSGWPQIQAAAAVIGPKYHLQPPRPNALGGEATTYRFSATSAPRQQAQAETEHQSRIMYIHAALR